LAKNARFSMSDRLQTILDFHDSRCLGEKDDFATREKKAKAAYLSLDSDELAELASSAISRIETGSSDYDATLCCIACLRPGSLSPFHDRLVQRQILYPGVIFWQANPEIARRLLPLCEEEDLCNHALVALAWIGDLTVQDAFAQWRAHPPRWVEKLYVPPHRYAEEAGWELTPEGGRRDLFSRIAYPLVCPNTTRRVSDLVRVGIPTEDVCPWCAWNLIGMLHFNDIGNVLQNEWKGAVRVLTCHVCSCYGHIFAKRNIKNFATWHSMNAKPEYLPPDSSDWEPFPESPLVMANETRHFMETANWMLPDVSFSQVGGLPTWIQDAEYPTCPECSKKTPFIGQISNEDFEEAEGIYYVFYCQGCGVTATSYQQS